MAEKSIKQLKEELAAAEEKNQAQAQQIEQLQTNWSESKEQLQVVKTHNENLASEVDRLNIALEERTDEVQQQAARLTAMQVQLEEARKANTSAEALELITCKVSWKDPAGTTIKKEVTIRNPKVRLPSGEIVFAQSLLKVAAGKELKEQELEASPVLAKLPQEEAQKIITKWTKINAGFILDTDSEEFKNLQNQD